MARSKCRDRRRSTPLSIPRPGRRTPWRTRPRRAAPARIWVRDGGSLPAGPNLNLILHVPPAPPGSPAPAAPQLPATTTGADAVRAPAAWLRCLRIAGAFSPNETPISGVDSSARSGPGGEIAFEETVSGQPVTRIARVVSAAHPVPGGFEMLVRARDQENLPATGTACRYYPPYQVRMRIDVAGDGLSDLRLPVPDGQPKRNAYLAVAAMDISRDSDDLPPINLPANIGPLSAPLQVVAVRPPPTGQPDSPVPFGMPEPGHAAGGGLQHATGSAGSGNYPPGVAGRLAQPCHRAAL